MIKVERKPIPNILELNSETWLNEYLTAKERFRLDPTAVNKRNVATCEKRYNHLEVKESLKEMFKKKCAFCESHITHIDYGQIEHFKPKSKFPDDCFNWNNFLLCCSVCNGKSNKGDKFPLLADGGPFINPVDENPDEFFDFSFDEVTQQFLVIPKHTRSITMLEIIKLNRDDLAEFRTKELFKIIEMLSQIIDNKEKVEKFFKLFSEEDQYYAFIKTIINRVKENSNF